MNISILRIKGEYTVLEGRAVSGATPIAAWDL